MALRRALVAQGHEVALHDSGTFRFAADAPEAELICISGGDGTARVVLDRQEDLSALPPLAIYPTGTINLLARELGYPRDPVAFARRISGAGNRCVSQVARAGAQTLVTCASAGPDAFVVETVSLALKERIGRLAYALALLRLMGRWPRKTMRLVADDQEFDAEAVFVLRGRHYAGPWSLHRGAGLEQERFHVLALPRARRRDIAGLIFYALTGARRLRPHWRLLQCRRLQVTASEPVPVQVDGDVVASLPLLFEMTGQAITWK